MIDDNSTTHSSDCFIISMNKRDEIIDLPHRFLYFALTFILSFLLFLWIGYSKVPELTFDASAPETATRSSLDKDAKLMPLQFLHTQF